MLCNVSDHKPTRSRKVQLYHGVGGRGRRVNLETKYSLKKKLIITEEQIAEGTCLNPCVLYFILFFSYLKFQFFSFILLCRTFFSFYFCFFLSLSLSLSFSLSVRVCVYVC